METTNDIYMFQSTVSDIDKKTLAIVRFSVNGPQRPIHYQVTIDPDRISPGSRYIRFGTYPSDEITGWQPVEDIVICEILSEDYQGTNDQGAAVWGKV